MSQVIASFKDDAAYVFDFVRGNNPQGDPGVIKEKLLPLLWHSYIQRAVKCSGKPGAGFL